MSKTGSSSSKGDMDRSCASAHDDPIHDSTERVGQSRQTLSYISTDGGAPCSVVVHHQQTSPADDDDASIFPRPFSRELFSESEVYFYKILSGQRWPQLRLRLDKVKLFPQTQTRDLFLTLFIANLVCVCVCVKTCERQRAPSLLF